VKNETQIEGGGLVSTIVTRQLGWLSLILATDLALLGLTRNLGPRTYEFTVYLIIFATVASVALVFRSGPEPIDILDPFVVALGLFTLYGWAGAVGVITEGAEFVPILPTYYRSLIIGLAGFIIGDELFRRAPVKILKTLTGPIGDPARRRFHILTVVLALVLVTINWRFFLESVDVSSLKPYTETAAASRAGRTTTAGAQELSRDLAFAAILISVFLRGFARGRLGVVALTAYAAYAIIGVMAGGKTQLLAFITMILVFVNYRKRRLPAAPVVGCGVVLYLFVTVFSHVRSTTSLTQMYDLGTQLIRSDPTLLSPGNSGEFAGPPRTMMNVITAIEDGRLQYSFGATYAADLATFVPRFLYPGRPLPVPERYMEIFYPGRLAEGYGEGNFLLTEGYWALGYAGVFLSMLVYGGILAVAYQFVRNNLQNDVVLLVYSIAFMYLVTAAMRTGLLGSVKTTAMITVPFMLLYAVSRSKRSGNLPA
jgi:hypothetical protein